MTFDPTGGAISGADDVAFSNPQTDEVLTYDASLEKWQNKLASGGSGADVAVAVSAVTETHANVQIIGRDAPDEQTVELRHVNAQAFVPRRKLQVIRTAWAISAPLIVIQV